MSRKHTLIQIKDAIKGKVFASEENPFDCSLHKNRKIELFCFDHAEPCCLTCMTVHHRKCDKVTTLEEAAENFREDPTFVSFTKRMNELTSELRNERTCHDKAEKNFALQISQVKDQAQTKKREMIKHIKMLYTKFEDEIKMIEKQHDAEDNSGTLTQKIVQLELFVKTLDTLRSTSSDLSVFLEFHKMKGKQKDFEEFLDQYKSRKKQESVEFICHENVRKFKSVVSSFGKVRVVDSLAQAQALRSATIDYTSCTLKQVVTIVEEGVRFTDAVCVRSGTILAVDDIKRAIWAYDDTGTLLTKSDLPSNPWALAVVDSNKVVVTLRDQKTLQFFTFHEDSKTFRKGNTIQLIETPWAIECASNNLFVTFSQKVKKITLDGRIINELVIPESSFSLYGISIFNDNTIVSDDGYIATYSIHFIMLDSTPLVKFQRKYSKLDRPLGVTNDREGNVYVAGWGSNSVIQLSRTGDLLREILPSSAGFKQLMGINFTHDGSKFILTHQNKITLFELQ
ncbi:hypothetical protein FSP39_021409 [Pinctada imbricata]|uniref:B box-type domain-containing protein n=1 Tax=Pinctada imbricata TaxID=66713 RepID=A0AA88YB73_PINIB|nr:hypothetical protein FSP39_021409 [Pinctada imbricata]